jgi:hypothetical protein
MRYPSCLISCSHSGPGGGEGAEVGRQGFGGTMGTLVPRPDRGAVRARSCADSATRRQRRSGGCSG